MKLQSITSKLFGIAVLSLVAFSNANAIPVTGGISMAGGATPVGGLGTATGIDFTFGFVTDTSGSFSSITPGTSVTINDFTFDPFPGGGVTPLWAVGNFSFDLMSLTSVEQDATSIHIKGLGTINDSSSTYDSTVGGFELTAQGGAGTFSWSSTTVPEPSTLLMLGGGLIGLAGLSKKKRKAA